MAKTLMTQAEMDVSDKLSAAENELFYYGNDRKKQKAFWKLLHASIYWLERCFHDPIRKS
mgnify:FL=1